MRCSFQPEREGIGVCANCGRVVCPTCAMELQGRTYCQLCANAIFTERSSVKPRRDRSGLLTAGGILAIVGGAGLTLFAVPVSLLALLDTILADDSTEALDAFVTCLIMLALSVLGVLQIVGGICALKRTRFGLALTGAICGTISCSILGIMALVFIAVSKEEFNKEQSPPYESRSPWES